MAKLLRNKLTLVQIIINAVFLTVLISTNAAYAQINIPIITPIAGQSALTLPNIVTIVTRIADFFIIVAPLILVVALIWSGITFMRAGASPTAVKSAKTMLGYSIVGGLLIFGVGVIINTIAAVVTGEFFCRVGFSLGPISGCLFN